MYSGRAIIMVLLLALLGISAAAPCSGSMNEYSDVLVYPGTYVAEVLEGADEGETVEIEVRSDVEVHIYVISLWEWSGGYYDEALYQGQYKEQASFTVDIPDEQEYVLIIENPGHDNAWVDYSYSVREMEPFQEINSLYCMLCGISGTVVLIIGGIVVAVILVSLSRKKNKRTGGRDGEIEKLENRIREMERSGMDTSRERELLERYRKR